MPMYAGHCLSFDEESAISALRETLIRVMDGDSMADQPVYFSASDLDVIRAWLDATK